MVHDRTGLRRQVEALFSENAQWFAQAAHVGVWHDQENEVIVFDRVTVVSTLAAAEQLAAARKQRFFFSFEANREVPVGSSGEPGA